MFSLENRNFRLLWLSLGAVALALGFSAVARGQQPVGCNASMVIVVAELRLDGELLFDQPVRPGQTINVRARLFVPSPLPPLVFCDVVGGQLSVTPPDGKPKAVAGYKGLPAISQFGDASGGYSNAIEINYVVNAADAVDGVLWFRIDYGATPSLPLQQSGTFLCNPAQAQASGEFSAPIWLDTLSANPTDCDADLNADGAIDAADLATALRSPSTGTADNLIKILTAWGACG